MSVVCSIHVYTVEPLNADTFRTILHNKLYMYNYSLHLGVLLYMYIMHLPCHQLCCIQPLPQIYLQDHSM